MHLRSLRLGIRKLLFTESMVKPCNGFLERSMLQVCWCLRGICTMPLIRCLNFGKPWICLEGGLLHLKLPRHESKHFLLVFRNCVYQKPKQVCKVEWPEKKNYKNLLIVVKKMRENILHSILYVKACQYCKKKLIEAFSCAIFMYCTRLS